MKLQLVLTFTMLLLGPLQVFGEEAERTVQESDNVQGSLDLDSQEMELALEQSGVTDKFDACKQSASAAAAAVPPTTIDVSECLWNSLDEKEKEKVSLSLNDLNSANTGNSNEDRYESLDTGFMKEAKKDPAFAAFQTFMKEKLEKIIYGDAEKNKLSGADHMVFHDIYKSQLSKNVIAAMSSYCMDADPSDSFFVTDDKKELEKIQKKNIDSLSDTTKVAGPSDPAKPNEPPKQMPIAQSNFNNCIGSLKNICYTTGAYINFSSSRLQELEEEMRKLEAANASKVQKQVIQRSIDRINGIYANSKTRACNVITYIKQLKQNIVAIEDISTKIKEHGKNNPGSGFQMGSQKVEVYGGEKNEAITNITSKEFKEESGFKTAAEEEAKGFEKCMADGQIIDETICEQYLNKDKEEAQKLIAEADLRGRALGKKIDDKLAKDGEKGVKVYLTDQGYTEEQIEKMLSDPELMNTIESQIKNRFEAERAAYIKTVRDRIEDKTLSTSDDDSITDLQASETKLKDIGAELANKTDNYTKLIHFNNIVSGFLETEDADGNRGKNTNAMAMELESNGYDPTASGGTARSTASTGGAEAHAEAIKNALESNGFKAELDETKTNTLQKGEIIKLFEYDGVKADKKTP